MRAASSRLRATAPPGPVRRISPHWAGYVAMPRAGGFTAVQATWVQPRIRCDRPDSSVAFWIGLGGATRHAKGLEQIGTTADCSDTLVPSYSAWIELIPVPARSVELPVSVAPGDTITAQVAAGDFCLRRCTTLPLVKFGNLTFTSATARTEAHIGTIKDSAWIHQRIKLTTTREQPAAVPSVLSADGRSFSVHWQGPHRRRGHQLR